MTDYGEPWALDYTPEDEGGPEAYELRARRLDPIVEGQPPSAFTDTIAIGHADDGWTVAGWEEHKRRMERIVACVNACQGIPTDELGRGVGLRTGTGGTCSQPDPSRLRQVGADHNATAPQEVPPLEVECERCAGSGCNGYCPICKGTGYLPTAVGMRVIELIQRSIVIDDDGRADWRIRHPSEATTATQQT